MKGIAGPLLRGAADRRANRRRLLLLSYDDFQRFDAVARYQGSGMKPNILSVMQAQVLVVLALAIANSVEHRYRRPAATPSRRRRTPSARERECYALGFVDALKKREYGSSIGANDAEHDDLVEATLEDLPPEAQGIRDQWISRSGIGRKEDVRAPADL